MDSITIILGPTGVGKTSYSLSVAEAMGSPVISCDSRQLFREMRIGTARPSEAQLARVKHYFIADRSIFEPYTAGQYELDAWDLVARLAPSHEQLLFVGGSCLYIDAFCRGIDAFPEHDPDLRASLNARLAAEGGLESLRWDLKRLDPLTYASIDLANGSRVLRALEVCLLTGRPYSSFRTRTAKPRPYPVRKTGLYREREDLYARIDARVDRMMDEGLLQEARSLYPCRHLPALNTVGYKELFGYFDGLYSIHEAIRLLKRNTRHYAKKQMSYWRRDASINWHLLS